MSDTPPEARAHGRVVVIDPGRLKYGWAVFVDGRMLYKGVQEAEDAPLHLRDILRAADLVLLGDGTSKEPFQKILNGLDVPVELIDEHNSTQEGLAMYFREEAPKSLVWQLRKLLNLPVRPVDDWAAVALGQRYFSKK